MQYMEIIPDMVMAFHPFPFPSPLIFHLRFYFPQLTFLHSCPLHQISLASFLFLVSFPSVSFGFHHHHYSMNFLKFKIIIKNSGVKYLQTTPNDEKYLNFTTLIFKILFA